MTFCHKHIRTPPSPQHYDIIGWTKGGGGDSCKIGFNQTVDYFARRLMLETERLSSKNTESNWNGIDIMLCMYIHSLFSSDSFLA